LDHQLVIMYVVFLHETHHTLSSVLQEKAKNYVSVWN